MIGNDLVDLKQAALDSNLQRKGYLNKIYSAAEQELIYTAINPAQMIWLLWTMKEAAYKIENRLTNRRFYAPLSFSCTNLTVDRHFAYGEVFYRDRLVFIESEITDHLVHSIACQNPSDHKTIQIRYLLNSAGYIQEFNAVESIYCLKKNNAGIPFVILIKNGEKYPASVSHHGKYLAVIFSGSLQLTS